MTSLEKFLGKKYKLDRTENFDAIMIELGINSILRKISKTLTTVVQLTRKEDVYSLNSTILLLTTSQKFKLGEGKDVTTQDGRKVNNIFTIEDNKLIEQQIGEKTFTIVREYFDEEMIVTATFGEVHIFLYNLQNKKKNFFSYSYQVVSTSWCKLVN